MKFLLLTFVLVFVLPAEPQSLQRIPPSKRPQGMVGYYLSQINPGDRDYGAKLAEKRAELVGDTVDNIYFWSNVVSISLLGVLGIWLVLEQRAKNKVEIIASHLIAQLWNGRISDRIEIENRTSRYNEIVNQLNEITEKKLSEKAIRKKKSAPAEASEPQMEQPNVSAAAEDPEISSPITRKEPEISFVTQREAIENAAVVVMEQTQIDAPRIVSSPSELKSKTPEGAGDIEEMRKALEASRQEVEQMKQELKVRQGQIQALQNSGKNLTLQLNQAMEFRKQNQASDRAASD